MANGWPNELWLRIKLLWKRAQLDRDLEDELAFHLAEREQANRAVGMEADEARYAARRQFGNAARVKERSREMWTFASLETIWHDVRYAARTLRKSPSFTAIAVLTLAIGIGANSAVFSVVHSVLLASLPYKNEDRLVMIWEAKARDGRDHNVVSPANFIYWREHSAAFEQMAAFFDDSSTLTGEGEPEQIASQGVSTNLFSVLGVAPVLGRDFLTEEGQRGRNHEVLLSYGLWKSRFGSEPSAVGKSIKLDGVNFLVVGVLPPNVGLFAWQGSLTGKTPQLWWPYGWKDDDRQPRGRWMTAVGRLRPNVSLLQAQTEMNGLVADFTNTYPDFETGWSVNLVPLHQDVASKIRPTLLLLLGAVALVLLITSANVANLLLTRASRREHELAVRTALGASRWRITRQWLTESVALASLGGALGILGARWTLATVMLLMPKDLHMQSIPLDWRVLVFVAVISLSTGVLFGIAPALDAARKNVSDTLREAGRSETGKRGQGLRNSFAIAQISMSLMLVAGASLLIRSFVTLSSVNPGFNPRNVLTLRISLPSSKYSKDIQYINFFHTALEQIRALPGVRAATSNNSFPLTGMTPGTDFDIDGRPTPPRGQERITEVQLVGSDYFRTMQIPLLRGRSFSDQEETEMSHVVIVSNALARQYFPGEEPLGRKIRLSMKDQNDFCEIIGIAADVKREGLDIGARAVSYWPHAELPFSSMMLAVRVDGDPMGAVGPVRGIIQRMDGDLPLSDISTMDRTLRESVARQHFAAVLVGIFAGIAVFLAVIGIYGVVSYAVSSRTREFGVRMALGARRADLLEVVLRQGLMLAAIGVLLGTAGDLALTSLIRGLLFGVNPYDPTTLASVATFLIAVTLAACWIPARRAMRVDPNVALRYE